MPGQAVTGASPFTVGSWTVEPDRLRLVQGKQEIVLQPRVMGALQHLVLHRGEVVSHQALVDAVWQGRVVEDGAVYQTLAKLRKALDDDHHHPEYIETIPKKGYRLIAPVAPVGVASEDPDVSRDSEIATKSRGSTPVRRPVLLVLFAALIVVLLTHLTRRAGRAPAVPATQALSIAVLPFVDMSPDGSRAYLGEGIAEEIIHTLSQMEGLRVLARTSSFALRDESLGARAIGRRLGVEAVLEGSIRQQGNRLWVTAQLVEVGDGSHLWSRKYDMPAGDAFAVQRDIARRVARIMQRDSGAASALHEVRSPEPDAYIEYLLGRHQRDQRRRQSLDAAIRHFERAIEIDPGFAAAHAALARTYFLASDRRYGSVPEADAIRQAGELAMAATELDAALADGWVERARLAIYRRDLVGAEVSMERALALSPSAADVQAMLGDLRSAQGRREESLAAFERAAEADPLSARLQLSVALRLEEVGQWEAAASRFRLAVQVDPDWHQAWYTGSYFFLRSGDIPESVRWAARAATVEAPGERNVHSACFMVGYGWFMLGRHDLAGAWFDLALAIAPSESPFFIENGRLHMLLAEGRDAEAHDLLRRFTSPGQTDAGVFALGGLYEMMLGHDDHALELYQRATTLPAPAFDDDSAPRVEDPSRLGNLLGSGFRSFGYLPAVNLAVLYRREGHVEEAERLLAASRTYVADGQTAGATYLEATLAVLDGNNERAVELLDEAVGAGWLRPWYLMRDPNLTGLRNHPRVGDLLETMGQRLESLRASLEADPGLALKPPELAGPRGAIGRRRTAGISIEGPRWAEWGSDPISTVR